MLSPSEGFFQVVNSVSRISNGNRTEWSPVRSVITGVIRKSDDRAAGVRFVYHEYDYRPNWTTPFNHQKKLQFPRKEEKPSYERKGKFALKCLQKRRKLFNVVLQLRLI